ncbi:Zn-dependent hydrolase [Alkalihalobacterium chitinilyticum]|uniref:Zn-dependent hydrolase n=1 Tax=Alkalihalobacterium chitinilyticum TaxID=2980103 RepID=A0ABT5VI81_9BACI|nr:Zn-dependent hydrolase [Alkalihalobacterium chitinilyticum]MDE5415162.1 Zn-dependent hydrolase [Alkalihalobacterium chitinilyticum]
MSNVFSKERLLQDVEKCKAYPAIDPKVLANRLDELAAIGKTSDGGVTRFVYTDEEKQAKELFKKWIGEAGLTVTEDPAGNIFARYEGTDSNLPVVMTGSHIDSVPNGGAFDGPLGCLSSLMAIEAMIQQKEKPKRSIEFVIFVNEEGSRFKNGIFGSRAMMGEVDYEELEAHHDDVGVTVAEAMRQQGLTPENIGENPRKPEDIYAFLELHIEQGKQLELNEETIGIVTGIAGPSWHTFTFYGETDHAGNTPMHMRKDTVAGAAEFILEVEKLPRQINETAVATVGKMYVYPNGTNVIAGKTAVNVDARDIHTDTLSELNERIVAKAHEIAEKRGLTVHHENPTNIPPVPVPENIQTYIKEAAIHHDLPYRHLVSGAGHDAMIVGKYVPAGMIFVPSVNGKSHSPEEFTYLSDCVDGIAVMKDVLWKLANE